MLCSYFKEETYLDLELASPSYQPILQDLLSIQIDKYETYSGLSINRDSELPMSGVITIKL